MKADVKRPLPGVISREHDRPGKRATIGGQSTGAETSARGMTDQTRSAIAIGYAKFRSRSIDAVIRIYDKAGNVIETHEHAGDFKEAS